VRLLAIGMLLLNCGCQPTTPQQHVFKCSRSDTRVDGRPSGRQCCVDSDVALVEMTCRDGCFDREAVWCVEIVKDLVSCYATQAECDWPDGTPRGCRETKIDELPAWMRKSLLR
jgi:hypothetical protein